MFIIYTSLFVLPSLREVQDCTIFLHFIHHTMTDNVM